MAESPYWVSQFPCSELTHCRESCFSAWCCQEERTIWVQCSLGGSGCPQFLREVFPSTTSWGPFKQRFLWQLQDDVIKTVILCIILDRWFKKYDGWERGKCVCERGGEGVECLSDRREREIRVKCSDWMRAYDWGMRYILRQKNYVWLIFNTARLSR